MHSSMEYLRDLIDRTKSVSSQQVSNFNNFITVSKKDYFVFSNTSLVNTDIVLVSSEKEVHSIQKYKEITMI